jgi:hypothetical protein
MPPEKPEKNEKPQNPDELIRTYEDLSARSAAVRRGL